MTYIKHVGVLWPSCDHPGTVSFKGSVTKRFYDIVTKRKASLQSGHYKVVHAFIKRF